MSTEQQAFPVVVDGYLYDGMTLRDYFAAKAMHALMINSDEYRAIENSKIAYHMADAMMIVREINKDQLL